MVKDPKDLEYPEDGIIIPKRKERRVLIILLRWVSGEISNDQADRELSVMGVKIRKPGEREKWV
jgi:hypothetical protein